MNFAWLYFHSAQTPILHPNPKTKKKSPLTFSCGIGQYPKPSVGVGAVRLKIERRHVLVRPPLCPPGHRPRGLNQVAGGLAVDEAVVHVHLVIALLGLLAFNIVVLVPRCPYKTALQI